MAVRILSTGSYVPEKILTNEDLTKIIDTTDDWIVSRTGIHQRHVAEPNTPCSELAVKASLRAMEAANIKAEEIDMIITASVSGDYVFPSTACIVQGKLNANNAACFDLHAACTGLIYSLETAFLMMQSAPHKYKTVLVIGAERVTYLMDWQDRSTCILFGDGAAAMILRNDPTYEVKTLVESYIQSSGHYTDLLNIPAGGTACPTTHETLDKRMQYIKMNGPEVFKLAVNNMTAACQKVLKNANIDSTEVRWFVPHQANYRILTSVAKYLKVPESQVYINVERYGNTSAASIGICLDEMNRNGLIKPGDLTLLTAFGGGLTWGAMLLRW